MSWITRPLAVAAVLLGAGTTESAPVSPAGHIVAEFSAATAAGDPQLMVASAIDSDIPAHIRCAVYVSHDGGTTWSEVPAFPESQQLSSRYDPWVAASADGTLHAACIVHTPKGSRVGYTRSTDGGVTWTPPRTVTPFPGAVNRRTADTSALGVAPDGTVYVCFNQILEGASLASALFVSRSTDAGLTWTTRMTSAGDAYCNGIVASSTGTVTSTYIKNNGTATAPLLQYGTTTSTDGGDTWNTAVVLGDVPSVALPSVVRDAAGRTVVAELAGQPTAPHLDVTIVNDAGTIVQQWQLDKPASATCTGGRILHPSLTAPPTGFPALQIACKVSPTKSTAGHQEVWLYPAIDGPGTTAPPILVSSLELPAGRLVSTSFATRVRDGGDYWGLTWRAGGWLGLWIDPRDGDGPGALVATPVSAD